MNEVGIVGTRAWLPQRWMTAAEIADGILQYAERHGVSRVTDLIGALEVNSPSAS